MMEHLIFTYWSKAPKTKHKNAHTDAEIKLIKDIIKRQGENRIGLNEFYTKLVKRNYTRTHTSLYRVLKRLGYYKDKPKDEKSILNLEK